MPVILESSKAVLEPCKYSTEYHGGQIPIIKSSHFLLFLSWYTTLVILKHKFYSCLAVRKRWGSFGLETKQLLSTWNGSGLSIRY